MRQLPILAVLFAFYLFLGTEAKASTYVYNFGPTHTDCYTQTTDTHSDTSKPSINGPSFSPYLPPLAFDILPLAVMETIFHRLEVEVKGRYLFIKCGLSPPSRS